MKNQGQRQVITPLQANQSTNALLPCSYFLSTLYQKSQSGVVAAAAPESKFPLFFFLYSTHYISEKPGVLHPTLRLRLCTSQHDHGGKKLQVETYALHKKCKNSGAASLAQYRSLSTSVSQLNSVRILNPNRKPGCSGNINSKPVEFPVCPVLIGSCVGSIE